MYRIRVKREEKTVAAGACHDLRRCEQCGNVVTDPLVVRCPRCWSVLPGAGCEGCTGCSLGKGH